MTTAYDNSKLRSYVFPVRDFGAGSDTTEVIAPPLTGRDTGNSGTGARGRVRGYTIMAITEDFVGTSTSAGVSVGDGSTAGLYYDDGLPLDSTVDIGESLYVLDNGSAVDIPGGETAITVTFTQGVGGSITGIATIVLDIEWFDI